MSRASFLTASILLGNSFTALLYYKIHLHAIKGCLRGLTTRADLAAGAKKHAIGFNTLQDVKRVDAALTDLSDASIDSSAPQPLISVVGAGYAGVELAATIAERMRGVAAVQLLSPSGEVLPVRFRVHLSFYYGGLRARTLAPVL